MDPIYLGRTGPKHGLRDSQLSVGGGGTNGRGDRTRRNREQGPLEKRVQKRLTDKEEVRMAEFIVWRLFSTGGRRGRNIHQSVRGSVTGTTRGRLEKNRQINGAKVQQAQGVVQTNRVRNSHRGRHGPHTSERS